MAENNFLNYMGQAACAQRKRNFLRRYGGRLRNKVHGAYGNKEDKTPEKLPFSCLKVTLSCLIRTGWLRKRQRKISFDALVALCGLKEL